MTAIDEPVTTEPAAEVPTLRVVRGEATDPELAALLAVLLAWPEPSTDPSTPPATSAWSAKADALRRPIQPGPGAWRASAWRR